MAEHEQHGIIIDYLNALNVHHHCIYVDCGKGTLKERELHAQLQTRFRTFPWQLKKTVNQIQKAAVESLSHPAEFAPYVKLLTDMLNHSRTVVLLRTEEMIGRRADGIYPKEDDPFDPNIQIYTTHDNVQRYDLDYAHMQDHQFDCVNVKIPLPVQNPAPGMPDVEFVWVWCKGYQDGVLIGDIYQEPQWASGFSEGDEVSFETNEVHDVHSDIAQPTDTLIVNNAEGLECLAFFCENIRFEEGQMEPHLTWFRMSDREKMHIVQFSKMLRAESRRKEDLRKAMAREL